MKLSSDSELIRNLRQRLEPIFFSQYCSAGRISKDLNKAVNAWPSQLIAKVSRAVNELQSSIKFGRGVTTTECSVKLDPKEIDAYRFLHWEQAKEFIRSKDTKQNRSRGRRYMGVIPILGPYAGIYNDSNGGEYIFAPGPLAREIVRVSPLKRPNLEVLRIVDVVEKNGRVVAKKKEVNGYLIKSKFQIVISPIHISKAERNVTIAKIHLGANFDCETTAPSGKKKLKDGKLQKMLDGVVLENIQLVEKKLPLFAFRV